MIRCGQKLERFYCANVPWCQKKDRGEPTGVFPNAARFFREATRFVSGRARFSGDPTLFSEDRRKASGDRKKASAFPTRFFLDPTRFSGEPPRFFPEVEISALPEAEIGLARLTEPQGERLDLGACVKLCAPSGGDGREAVVGARDLARDRGGGVGVVA